MEAHSASVAIVAAKVKEFHMQQKPFRIYHGTTGSTRPSDRRLDNTVDTSKLNKVLHVDKSKKVVLVEPNVPMDALVEATLPHALMPAVVMEFPHLTAGGGFSGSSGESSSFRHGPFEATVNFVEMVLPNGEITRASKTERPDLFWGAASALGTLGIVTVLEIQLIDAKKYVEITYTASSDMAGAIDRIQEATSNMDNDYVDGIVLSPTSTVLCAGRLVDTLPPGQKAQRFARRHDPWFYLHAQSVQKKLQWKSSSPSMTITEYVPLVDYLFRYDRGSFWCGAYGFKYFLVPFNRLTRYFVDSFMHTRFMYRAMHKSGLADTYMVQDVGIPYDKAEEFIEWLHDTFKIYPLWLCPLRVRRDSPDAAHGLHSEFADANAQDLLNFGIWGPISSNRVEAISQNRALEHKVRELGGKKWLYAHTYYTEDEFWAHYDRESYNALRAKYGAAYLPSVFDKVKVDTGVVGSTSEKSSTHKASRSSSLWDIWPIRGYYGFFKAAVGGDYLLQKSDHRSTGTLDSTKQE